MVSNYLTSRSSKLRKRNINIQYSIEWIFDLFLLLLFEKLLNRILSLTKIHNDYITKGNKTYTPKMIFD